MVITVWSGCDSNVAVKCFFGVTLFENFIQPVISIPHFNRQNETSTDISISLSRRSHNLFLHTCSLNLVPRTWFNHSYSFSTHIGSCNQPHRQLFVIQAHINMFLSLFYHEARLGMSSFWLRDIYYAKVHRMMIWNVNCNVFSRALCWYKYGYLVSSLHESGQIG